MIARFLKTTAALALVLTASIEARADTYFGGSAGTAITYPAIAELEVSAYNLATYGAGSDCVSLGCSSLQNEPDAWKIFLGVRSGPNVAIEGFYARLGQYHSDADDGLSVTAIVDAEIETAGVAAVAFAPLSPNAALFGKIGVHAWRMEGITDLVDSAASLNIVETFETSGNGLMAGIGAEFDITPHVALRTEYEFFGGETEGGDFAVGLFSVGAMMRF